ncbi:MAG TPA: nucleotidyltransferase family protein [Blastocatellia bacterium]|nr:nucleotidyltransferase family protein [Blastocatellia bacterium]
MQGLSKEREIFARGALVAKILEGSWRGSPPALALSRAALSEAAPLLLRTGAAGLGWWRVRLCELKDSEEAAQFREAYLLHTIQAVLHEREIDQALSLFRSFGVEPLLVKGWAVARLYPEPGLRPYGDVDLCVPPEQYPAALSALESSDGECNFVDLHKGSANLDYADFDDVYARSRLVAMGDVSVRVPSPEDHLRILCMHLLRHGAWRHLWLCDVAAALESRGPDFDWEVCLGSNSRRSDWVACAIGLARELLGARADDTPAADRAGSLPGWLLPTVLKQWSVPYKFRVPVASYLRRPSGFLREIRHHWPNPIEATINMRGPFNGLPRFPFQVGDSLSRAAKFLRLVPKLMRNR